MIKDFREWHALKTEIQHRKPPSFQEREIWWCSLGLNIRHETDGKGSHLRRPVLILRKFNADSFLGIPLTTVAKENPYYFRFHFHSRVQYAMISQLRLIDAARLTSKMGQVKIYPFDALRKAVKEMI